MMSNKNNHNWNKTTRQTGTTYSRSPNLNEINFPFTKTICSELVGSALSVAREMLPSKQTHNNNKWHWWQCQRQNNVVGSTSLCMFRHRFAAIANDDDDLKVATRSLSLSTSYTSSRKKNCFLFVSETSRDVIDIIGLECKIRLSHLVWKTRCKIRWWWWRKEEEEDANDQTTISFVTSAAAHASACVCDEKRIECWWFDDCESKARNKYESQHLNGGTHARIFFRHIAKI